MISIGVAGTWPTELIAELAVQVESGGFGRLWVNDVPGGEALSGLAAAASVTRKLRLATGVIALDRNPAAAVEKRVRELALPVSRLDLGAGSGGWQHPLDRVAEALDELRTLKATLWVGALGPRMRQLAAEHADGLLLNWLTPAEAHTQAVLAAEQAHAAGRPAPQVAIYVRTAVDPASDGVLAAEASRYAQVPGYAANFARLEIAPIEATINSSSAVRDRVAEYEAATGEVVVRLVVPGEPTLEDALRILDAVHPAIM
jgi:alkanesulfonate monooxygenase SsuD/methylene tetrahydromethanopterin reductase-like flavin-dependent oxidoreductase (luciferase family)